VRAVIDESCSTTAAVTHAPEILAEAAVA
jgi:hypothetical protein